MAYYQQFTYPPPLSTPPYPPPSCYYTFQPPQPRPPPPPPLPPENYLHYPYPYGKTSYYSPNGFPPHSTLAADQASPLPYAEIHSNPNTNSTAGLQYHNSIAASHNYSPVYSSHPIVDQVAQQFPTVAAANTPNNNPQIQTLLNPSLYSFGSSIAPQFQQQLQTQFTQIPQPTTNHQNLQYIYNQPNPLHYQNLNPESKNLSIQNEMQQQQNIDHVTHISNYLSHNEQAWNTNSQSFNQNQYPCTINPQIFNPTLVAPNFHRPHHQIDIANQQQIAATQPPDQFSPLANPLHTALEELKKLVKEAMRKHEFTAPPPPLQAKNEEEKTVAVESFEEISKSKEELHSEEPDVEEMIVELLEIQSTAAGAQEALEESLARAKADEVFGLMNYICKEKKIAEGVSVENRKQLQQFDDYEHVYGLGDCIQQWNSFRVINLFGQFNFETYRLHCDDRFGYLSCLARPRPNSNFDLHEDFEQRLQVVGPTKIFEFGDFNWKLQVVEPNLLELETKFYLVDKAFKVFDKFGDYTLFGGVFRDLMEDTLLVDKNRESRDFDIEFFDTSSGNENDGLIFFEVALDEVATMGIEDRVVISIVIQVWLKPP